MRLPELLRRSAAMECLIAGVLFLVLFSFGVWYARGEADAPIDGNPHYWQVYALGVALGHGPMSPSPTPILDDFLNKRTRSLDPAAVPADVTWAPIVPFSETHL